jgi:ORF6N domain
MHYPIANDKLIDLICQIRGRHVMLDKDLAILFQVETRVLNQAVKRNQLRFPETFCFQMNDKEFINWKSQVVISNSEKMSLRKNPFVFTEQGVAMLSSVLRSDTAIHASIQVMDAFVKMRHFLESNSSVFKRLDYMEIRQLSAEMKIDGILEAIHQRADPIEQGIFFEGQIFDAYNFVADLLRTAKKSIDLMDNYISEKVFSLLSKRGVGTSATIYTKKISKQIENDLSIYHEQFRHLPIELKISSAFHDRFLLIDRERLYHFGASIKDLGKKCFAFSKMNNKIRNMIIEELNNETKDDMSLF